MSVTLNEFAIERLLSSPDGPVARDVQQRAAAMLEVYKARARQIFEGSTGIQGDERVVMVPGPDLQFTIGFLDGRIEEYLAPKIEREADLLRPSLEAAFRS